MRIGFMAGAVGALVLWAVSALAGQQQAEDELRPMQVTGRFSTFSPSVEYAQACGYSALGLGVELRTPGRGYAVALADSYRSVGGTDIGCIGGRVDQHTIAYPVHGGLYPGNFTRLAAGAGASAGSRLVRVEAEARAGLVWGRPGWGDPEQRNVARNLPWLGYAVGGSVLEFLVLRWEHGWTRLRFREEVHPWPQPREVRSEPAPRPGEPPYELRDARRWSDFSGLSLGIRLSLGRRTGASAADQPQPTTP